VVITNNISKNTQIMQLNKNTKKPEQIEKVSTSEKKINSRI